jgi:hypothetical protein
LPFAILHSPYWFSWWDRKDWALQNYYCTWNENLPNCALQIVFSVSLYTFRNSMFVSARSADDLDSCWDPGYIWTTSSTTTRHMTHLAPKASPQKCLQAELEMLNINNGSHWGHSSSVEIHCSLTHNSQRKFDLKLAPHN